MATKRDFVIGYGLQADKSVGSTNTLVVDYINDKVGIGTTNPSERLQVSGNTYITGNLTVDGTINFTTAQISSIIQGNSSVAVNDTGSNGTITLSTEGAPRLTVSSTGQMQVGGLGSASAPVWSFSSDQNTGLYSPGTDQLSISTSGTQKLTLDSLDGNAIIDNNFPAVRPTLDLAFALTKRLDPRITFTRASTGTYVGADGLIKTAAVNEARFDHNPTTGESLGLLVEEQRTNLNTNSEAFDTYTASAGSVSANQGVAPNGTSTADEITSTGGGVFKSISGTTASTVYTVSVFAKYISGGGIFSFGFDANPSSGRADFDLQAGALGGIVGANVTSRSITPYGNGWYRCSVTATVTSTSTIVVFYSATSGAKWLCWGAQLEAGAFPTSYIPTLPTFVSRASTATFFDASGVLQTAGVNVARSNAFLPDSSGVMRSIGLLAEEARTNSIRNNTMVGAVAGTPGTLPTNWSYAVGSGGLSREIVGTGTENGINYIDFRFYGTTTNTNAIAIGIDAGSAATGQTWTGSLYWKLVGGSLTGITASTVGLIENTSGGVFVSGAFYTVNNPSGSALSLQRVSATRTLSGGATVASCLLVLNFTVTNSTAIDLTLRIGLPQLEQGAFATSVIPTSGAAATRAADVSTSATATRNADVASITGTNFSSWYRQDEGTVFADTSREFAVPSTAFPVIFDARVQPTDIVQISYLTENLAGQYVVNNTVTQSELYPAGFVNVRRRRLASAYGINNFAISGNGNTPSVDNLGTPPSNIASAFLGSVQGSSQHLNGTICRLTYWPARLANSTLQSITA